MSLQPSIIEMIARLRTDLRMGVGVVLSMNGRAGLVMAAETLTEDRVKDIRALGVKPGITLKPATPFEEIKELLPLVDLVLIMTVNPGFSGQGFMPEPLEKIKLVKTELERLNHTAYIEVDGGVNAETRDLVVEAGANVLVSGSYVFKNDYKETVAYLKGK